jgi:F0F1-type ATP synthase assembly protein I|tara:strand:- start:177 stop:374 length:198 start_codon:yes stop_codon:yes gene_type:complete
MPKKPNNWMAYSGLGIQMAVTMMVCLWLGNKAEVHLGVTEPWGQLGGLFFGLFASTYNLFKSINN